MYPKYYQSYTKDVSQLYQRLFIWKLLRKKKKGFLNENSYYSRKCLKKDLLLLAKKLIEKIPDPCNAKEYCQTFT